MLIFFSFLILLLVEYSHASREQDCGNPLEALEVVELEDQTNTYIYTYLCPADSQADIAHLEELSRKYYTPLRVNPIFTVHLDRKNKSYKCGFKKHQYLHYFGYYHCGGLLELNILREAKNQQDVKHFLAEYKPQPLSTFDVCFDTSKGKTIYTTHVLPPPLLYQDPQFVENPYCEKEISTEPFNMDSNRFVKIKELYESQLAKDDQDQNAFRMIPQPLVPAKFFPTRSWKKTTNHYINREHLWEELAPLINLVDQGIEKAAHQVFLRKPEQSDETLFIYTRTISQEKVSFFGKIKKFFKRNPSPVPLSKPSIWYKLLYNEAKKQAIMIYIHNTPSHNVEPIKKQCEDHMVRKCDFRAWSTDTDFSKINEFVNLGYAYCCEVTSQYAKKIFSRDFDIENVFNIDSFIINPAN